MISNTGIWSSEEAFNHLHSSNLGANISNFLTKNNKVIDFGCGNGYYLSILKEEGFDVEGYDGYIPTTPYFKGNQLDLSKPIDLGYKGQILSFEVGEHIPEEYESIFLDNLVRNSNGTIIMSWAIPNQPGLGHVNCKSNEYIKEQMANRGFKYYDHSSKYLRSIVEDEVSYFRNTLMVFSK